MKSFFRFALLALVLLVVALLSALTAMRFAIHGRETKVPDLVGKTPLEARRIADANGFDLEIERQYYSPTVPEGRILSQLPEAGTLTRRGWQLRAAESLGPQRVQIPNAIGESERAAEINIKRRGLDVGAIAEISLPGATADQVIAQDPPANAIGVSAPKISLLTGEPAPPLTYVMPSFIGQTLSSATSALKDAGFQLGKLSVAHAPANPAPASSPPVPPTSPTPPPQPAPPSQPSANSVIVSQNPPAGWKIDEGAAISFEVK
jgi:beta-lactam-binding protein with PASTA domain